MSTSPDTESRARGRARRGRRLAVAAVLLLVLGALAWSARAPAVAWIATRVARGAGYELVVEDLAIEGVTRVRASRLEARALTEAHDLRAALVRDLALDVDPRALLAGGAVVRAVRASSASLDIDLDRSGAGGGGGTTFTPGDLRALPRASIDALDLDLRAGRGRLRLDGARVDLAPAASGSAPLLAVDADRASVAWDGRARTTRLGGTARLDERGAIDARLEVDGVATLAVRGLTIGSEGRAAAHVDFDSGAGRAALDLSLEDGDLVARGTLADVDLARVLDLLGADPDGYSGLWSARGTAVVPLADARRSTAEAEVTTGAVGIAGRAFDALDGRVVLDRERLAIERVLVAAGANAAIVERASIPRGADKACEFLARATVDLDVDLADPAAVLGAAWALPEDAPPHRVRARAQLADGWVSIARASAEIGASRLDLRSTRLPVLGGALLDPSTELVLDVRAPDAGELARLVLPAEAERELALSGAVDGSVRLATARDGLAARVDLSMRDGSVRGVAVQSLAVRATADSGRIEVNGIEARAGRSTLSARGRVDLVARTFEGLHVDVDAPDLDDLVRAVWATSAPVTGGARLRAHLDGPMHDPVGDVEVSAESIAVLGLDVAWIRVRARGARSAFEVEDLSASLPAWGELRAAGVLDVGSASRWSARVERLEVRVPHATAILAGPARVRATDDGIEIDDLCLAGSDGALRVAEARIGDAWCADVDLSALRPARLLGTLGLWAPESLRADGAIELSIAPADDGGFDGPVEIDLHVAADEPDGARASGSARATIDLGGTVRAPRGSVAVEGRSLAWRGSDESLVTGIDLDALLRFGDAIELERAELRMIDRLDARAAGVLAARLDLDRFVREGADAWLDAPLDVRLDLEARDFAPVSEVFRSIRRVEGAATARVDARGTLLRPAITGRASLRNGGVKLAASLPALSDLDADIAFDGRIARIESAHGAWGGGEFEVSGTVDASGADPALDLRLAGRSLPLLRTATATVRADAELAVGGTWTALTLGGNATLRDARIEKRLDLDQLRDTFAARPTGGSSALLEVPAIQEAPFDAMSLDLTLRSVEPVRVRTPLLQAAVRTDLTIRGTGAAPILQGSLDLASGRVALPASELDIARGRIEFDPSEPGRARLDVTAEGRVSGYEVRARLTGSADDPLVELSSIPPADEEDLVLLLLAGRTPGSRELDGTRVMGEVASIVARDFAYQWFGDAAEGFTDRIEFASGGDVTRSGADTIDVRFRLTGPSRGAGRAIYLRGERDLYDRFNMGLRFVLRTP